MSYVSTLAVEWIEIVTSTDLPMPPVVSTLAVEWIEMPKALVVRPWPGRLHPRGGVD